MKEPRTQGKEAKAKKAQSTPGLTLSIIAAVFVIFMALFIYTGPMKRYKMSEGDLASLRDRYARLVQEKESEQARLRSQEELMTRLKERKPNFDLWSFINTALTETKLKDRAQLENYKPRSARKNASQDATMVQLKLNGFMLKEFVDLLHKIYSSPDLIVMYRLEGLRPTSDQKGLECTITFLTPKA